MIDIDATLDRLLAAPAATAPSFAADGTLYFLDDRAGSAQVWAMPPGGGPAGPRTAHRDAVAFVAGSPADGSAVFGRDAAGDERTQFYTLTPEGEVAALTADPQTMHGWGAYSPDGAHIACTANSRDPAHADPVVIAVAGGQAHRLAELQGPHVLHAWNPDAQSMVFGAAPRAFESDLFQVGLDGNIKPLTPHEGDWRHMNPRWRKDGAALWLLCDRGRAFLGVASVAPGGEPHFLYAPEADVEKLEVSPDQQRLAVVVNEAGYSRLRLLDAVTGVVIESPEHPAGAITKLTWRPDGGAIVFDLITPTRPSSLWAAEAGQAAHLLFEASPAPAGTRDYTTVDFPTFDGLSIPAYLATPGTPPPPGGWPVVVWVHGGPESQSLPNWRPDLQAFLAMGIAVLIPNVRGSTGYGRDYAALDDREKRPGAVRDLAAAHSWLSGQDRFDGARIAVYGQSYGGWMVLSAVTEFPELWACGVDYYGIARWKTFFERTGAWRIEHRAAEYGHPVRDADLLESLSPLHKADRIRCPMFVAQGLTDPRVPPHESEQIVEVLRGRKIEVEYLTFPDEGHGFLKRDNRRTAWQGVTKFLGRHLLQLNE